MCLALGCVDHDSGILSGFELGVDGLHLLFYGLTVGGTGADDVVNVFEIAHFVVDTEECLETLVGVVQIAVLDLHVLVGDGAVGESGHEGFGRLRARFELCFGADGVDRHRSHEERLIFRHEQFATQLLLGVLPQLFNRLNLLCHFGSHLLALHFLDLLQESLKRGVVEASGLSHEHGQILESLCATLAERIFNVFVGDQHAQFVALMLDEFVLNVIVPNLVAYHVGLFVGERTAAAELGHFRSFVHHLVELLGREALAIDFSDIAIAVRDRRNGVGIQHHGEDEQKHAEAHEEENPRAASDFL